MDARTDLLDSFSKAQLDGLEMLTKERKNSTDDTKASQECGRLLLSIHNQRYLASVSESWSQHSPPKRDKDGKIKPWQPHQKEK